MMIFGAVTALFLAQDHFTTEIRPVLMQNCAQCHNPANAKGAAPFLKAASVQDVQTNRGLWRNVAAQLRNRSMPPRDSKLSEADRLHIASWIETRLHETACNGTDYAGAAVTRRLNRREYRNTVRELFGLDFDVNLMLPADGTGGAGFDTNGETLYIPPVLMERYMEAAQQILDRVIVTPPLQRTFKGPASVALNIYADATYDVVASSDAPNLVMQIDGAAGGTLTPIRNRKGYSRISVHLSRGSHSLRIDAPEIVVLQRPDPALTPERRAAHFRLTGIESGESPSRSRVTARMVLEQFLPKAFRRAVGAAEVDKFLALYDRAAERGDPFEERLKLALKAVLVYPDFLFRIEKKHAEPGIHALSQHELAARLSYFLWSAPPDETLQRLAEQNRLNDPKTLAAQVDRMLDHPRSRAFVSSFTGQWLGTQDIGGRVVPLLTEIQSYYTPEIAADLKQQPVLLLDRILTEDRSLIELLDGDYTHLTARLAKFYQIEDQVSPVPNDGQFHLVTWPKDGRRAGILGLAGVQAMSSRYQETSPVLRGAWVLETLLGTPVPPPPPDVPPLEEVGAGNGHKLSMREKLELHRASPACAACHRLMDPIGFGLENFDWMGRWRDTDDGKPVNASGELPSGEKFNGVVELRAALLARKKQFVENLATRTLGYALGRSLQDGDSCTIQRVVQALEKNGYKGRSLIREIVLSVPFRNTQGGKVEIEPAITHRTLNISSLNATKQDAESHNNQVQVGKKK
jgi:cytochrome c553